MFKNKRISQLLVALILVFAAVSTRAGTPQKINYQGYIKQNGVPVNTSVGMTFTLFDAAAAGAQLCAESATVPVNHGRFNYLIGTGCDISTIDWHGKTVYLEIAVAGNTLSPREQIVSAVYSLSNDKGTPDTTFTLDKDNTAAGNDQSLMFNRGSSAANDAMLTWDEANDRFLLLMQPGIYASLSLGIASATKYYGDGSSLTGISSTDSSKVAKTGDTMSGALIVNNNITATGTIAAASLSGNGAAITSIDANNISAGTLSDTRYSAYADLTAETKIGTGAAQVSAGNHAHTAYVAKTGDTMSGALNVNNNITATGTVTANAFVGNGVGITGITSTDVTKVAKTGDTMSGALTVNNTITAIGNISTATGTISAANLSGNGSAITNIDANNISAGTLSDTRYSAYADLTAETKIGTGAAQVSAGNHAHTAYVAKSGDSMTGALTVNNSITATGTITAPTFSGAFAGNGSALTSVNAAQLGGLATPAFATSAHVHTGYMAAGTDTGSTLPATL